MRDQGTGSGRGGGLCIHSHRESRHRKQTLSPRGDILFLFLPEGTPLQRIISNNS